MVAYVFDVDGTLTPSRSLMDEQFRNWFLNFEKNNEVYLVTGSDYAKTFEQVGSDVIKGCRMIFNCCGNEVRYNGEIVYMSKWSPSNELVDILSEILEHDSYPVKTGKHLEFRTGMINFSIVGRNASKEERAAYFKYDQETNHRVRIVEKIGKLAPHIIEKTDFTIAGETGIDIYEKGCDKSQVLDYIRTRPIYFFGDRCEPGGNDYAIATDKRVDRSYNVNSWQHTQKILEDLEFVVDIAATI